MIFQSVAEIRYPIRNKESLPIAKLLAHEKSYQNFAPISNRCIDKDNVKQFRGYLRHCTRHLYYCICWLHLVSGARKHTLNEDCEYPAPG